jgi:hypothetical protein
MDPELLHPNRRDVDHAFLIPMRQSAPMEEANCIGPAL